jgi:hypothetical protein
VRGTHDARRTIHRTAEIVVVALLDHPRVETAADAQRDVVRSVGISQCLL